MVVPLRPEEVPQDLVCAICLSVPSDPSVVANCSHIFCTPCIEQSNGLSSNALCPVCRCDSSVVKSLKEFGPIAYRIWSGIAVKCDNHGEGCAWTGSVSEYIFHVCPKAARRNHQHESSSNEGYNLLTENERLVDENNRLQSELDTLRQELRDIQTTVNEFSQLTDEIRQVGVSAGMEAVSSIIEIPMSNGNGGYAYDRFKVDRLTKLICQYLMDKPSDINAHKIFECVRNIFGDLQKNYDDNPSYLYEDVRMLISVCLASAGWFTGNQMNRIREMASQKGWKGWE